MSEEIKNDIPSVSNTVINTPSSQPVNTLTKTPVLENTPKEKSNKLGWGVVIGMAVLWVVLLLIYFLIPGKSSKQTEIIKPVSTTTTSVNPQITVLPALNLSDEPESLNQDLDNTDVENLDTELGDVEKELNTP